VSPIRNPLSPRSAVAVRSLILHGGWGYQIYPFDRQIAGAGARIPVRDSRSHRLRRIGRLDRFAIDFHQRAADETLA